MQCSRHSAGLGGAPSTAEWAGRQAQAMKAYLAVESTHMAHCLFDSPSACPLRSQWRAICCLR
eukprot:scaffold73751_cov33-Tisochrysis_lutea.AAC.4